MGQADLLSRNGSRERVKVQESCTVFQQLHVFHYTSNLPFEE
jgi:hypothetical protein